jgi:hypothetical protein
MRVQPPSGDHAVIYLHPSCPDTSTDELAVSFCVSATLYRSAAPAPASLDAALDEWSRVESHQHGFRRLAQGTSPTGVFYTVQTYEARVGFSSGGRNVHTWKPVSRVYAVVAAGTGSVSCTGYVEHGADSADEASVATVRDLCMSMRARPPP